MWLYCRVEKMQKTDIRTRLAATCRDLSLRYLSSTMQYCTVWTTTINSYILYIVLFIRWLYTSIEHMHTKLVYNFIMCSGLLRHYVLTIIWEFEPKRKKEETHQHQHIHTRTQWLKKKKPAFQRPINWLLIKFILYFIGQDRVNVSTNIKTTYFLCAFLPQQNKKYEKTNRKKGESKREKEWAFIVYVAVSHFYYLYSALRFSLFIPFYCYTLNRFVACVWFRVRFLFLFLFLFRMKKHFCCKCIHLIAGK